MKQTVEKMMSDAGSALDLIGMIVGDIIGKIPRIILGFLRRK